MHPCSRWDCPKGQEPTQRTFQHQHLNWAAKFCMRLCRKCVSLKERPTPVAFSSQVIRWGENWREREAAQSILAGQGPSRWGRSHGRTTERCINSAVWQAAALTAGSCWLQTEAWVTASSRTWPRPPAGSPCPPGAGAVTAARSPSPALPWMSACNPALLFPASASKAFYLLLCYLP